MDTFEIKLAGEKLKMILEKPILAVALSTAALLNAGFVHAVPILEQAPYCSTNSSIDNSPKSAVSFVKLHSNSTRLKAAANEYSKECAAGKGTITNHLTQVNFDFGKINMMCLGQQSDPAQSPEVTSRAFLFDNDGHMKSFDLGNECVNRIDFEKEVGILKKYEDQNQTADAKSGNDRSINMDAERQQFSLFRKSLKEGDETSCGLVIEKKGKLAKVQLATSNVEKWMRVEDLFPTGHSCSDDEHSVVTHNVVSHTSIGQKVCKTIQITRDYAFKRYAELVNLTGFVENTSGQKVQIRISGMVSNGSEITPQGTNLDRINGDVILENGSIIWDDAAAWSSCNK